MRSGKDVLDVGGSRVGQTYVFGAHVPLDNPHWSGPWNCAEFASWCVYQAYDYLFGTGSNSLSGSDPYSGFWNADAQKRGTPIAWKDALRIPGAALIRAPAPGKIGHVAFSMGDNARTLEARGAAFGVGIFDGALDRAWSIGCLLPGVDYQLGRKKIVEVDAPESLPANRLYLAKKELKGPVVVTLQRALKAAGVDPGPIDGEFGSNTQTALAAFQALKGLEVDGVLGPQTAIALGLAFPLVASDEDKRLYEAAHEITAPPPVAISAPAGAVDTVTTIVPEGKSFRATTAGGFNFLVGTSVPYTDDMARVGLYQAGASLKDSQQFGAYVAADFEPTFGPWATFIEPTLCAEGGARFATLNTYDRAAFTFGAPQLAAHTPDANFIIYLRKLLDLPGAAEQFPDLSLRKDATGTPRVHRKTANGTENLETVVLVTRPNGKRENQLTHLTAYLNASPTAVDEAELTAAARLMNWLRLDPRAKACQIEVFIEQAQRNLARAKAAIPAFTGLDWRIALWIMDIMHQGRGDLRAIAAALGTSDPEDALRRIGNYAGRVKTVAQAVERIAKSGKLKGFKV